jgi:hypothetical protein
MPDQPELRIDPPAASADEDYREKCFEDLRLCIDQITVLAGRILRKDKAERTLQDVADASSYVIMEMSAAILATVVDRWQERI